MFVTYPLVLLSSRNVASLSLVHLYDLPSHLSVPACLAYFRPHHARISQVFNSCLRLQMLVWPAGRSCWGCAVAFCLRRKISPCRAIVGLTIFWRVVQGACRRPLLEGKSAWLQLPAGSRGFREVFMARAHHLCSSLDHLLARCWHQCGCCNHDAPTTASALTSAS